MYAMLDKTTKVALEYNFLYLEDSTSLDILISSLGIEQHGLNLQFRQAIFNKISKSLNEMYKKRNDRDYIISAVQRMVYDDINRLEIILAIHSYVYGKKSTAVANEMEGYFLHAYPEIKINKDMKLIRKKLTSRDYRFRNKLIEKVKIDFNINEMFENKIEDFFQSKIKENILNLNNYIHKQVKLEFKNNKYFIFQKENFLTKQELEDLYKNILDVFYAHIEKNSKRFIWHGLNDKVISRYR